MNIHNDMITNLDGPTHLVLWGNKFEVHQRTGHRLKVRFL